MLTDHDHHHSDRCWWDHTEARWVCPPDTRLPIDTRDMEVVHTALLRECRLAPAAVRGAGDRRRAARTVGRHLRFVLDLLEHHHAGEDRLLWPLLDQRALGLRLVLETVQHQHADIERRLAAARAALDAWSGQGQASRGTVLADRLEELHGALVEHLDLEEREVLPVAAVTLSEEEWHQIGEAAVAATPRSALPLAFGVFAYEADPVVLGQMLRSAPPLPRRVLPIAAPRLYARRARRVHGTPAP